MSWLDLPFWKLALILLPASAAATYASLKLVPPFWERAAFVILELVRTL
jgi:hypothetical protein